MEFSIINHFYKEQTIEFKPFTLLAGANSSGKSSNYATFIDIKANYRISL